MKMYFLYLFLNCKYEQAEINCGANYEHEFCCANKYFQSCSGMYFFVPCECIVDCAEINFTVVILKSVGASYANSTAGENS